VRSSATDLATHVWHTVASTPQQTCLLLAEQPTRTHDLLRLPGRPVGGWIAL